MIERPILFSAPMVRAILEGRKTQTRRIIKPQPAGQIFLKYGCWNSVDQLEPWTCPYGQPGDRLWVRESWCPGRPGYVNGDGKPYGVLPFERSWPIPKEHPEGIVVRYAATWNNGDQGDEVPPMRPSIHMPRWASRITLGITDVRVQRLQDIQEADALAEGIKVEVRELGALDPFKRLWDSINAKRAPWESNPWVWCLAFKRVKP